MRIPKNKRYYVEDFEKQKEWIGNLINPLNTFIEEVILCFDKGISVNENTNSSIVSVLFDRVPSVSNPIIVKWDSKVSPMSMIVGNVALATGTLTITGSVFAEWKFTSTKGLQVTNLFGVTPSKTNQCYITFNIFAG